MGLVNYEQNGAVGIITINRPEAMNALNAAVFNELEPVLDSIDVDTVRCVIITGAGNKSFVAGADIREMETLSKAEGAAWGARGNAIMRKIETLAVPVIAAVNGFALGGGCELALACDIRIASENAVFAQPEVGLGIICGFGGTQRLPRVINPSKAKELIYTGDKVKAQEALELGLVTAVYPQEQLMDEAMKMANKIAASAPIGVRSAKKAIDQGLQLHMDAAIALEAQAFGSCFDTKDQKNAMKAFVERKSPNPL